MELIFVVLALLLSGTAQAAHRIVAVLELPNRMPIQGALIVNEGEPATLSVDGFDLELESTSRDGAIVMKPKVFRTGSRVGNLVPRPELISIPEHTAEISDLNTDGTLRIRLKLTPYLVK